MWASIYNLHIYNVYIYIILIYMYVRMYKCKLYVSDLSWKADGCTVRVDLV